MRISIQVQANQARQQIKQVETDVRALNQTVANAGGGAGGLFSAQSFDTIARWGSQIQWAGRQLAYNFTLPIVGAGTAATKWALDVESAMVRLQKVYGDSATGSANFARDVDGLNEAFERLSVQYGTTLSEVTTIGAEWAAAGAQAGTLASGVESTLQTMILSEMDAVESTRALIAIQAQYGFNSEQLMTTIQQLNAVENETAVTFADLVNSMQRSAGAARSAGVDVEHLVAMTAALVPASGGAAQAGNALRTMISRIMSPTGDAAEVLGLMGINMQSLDWTSLNATERIEELARRFHELEGAGDGYVSSQAAVVSATVASRWNINRFDVLMRDIHNSIDDNAETSGYYGRALELLADDAGVAAIAHAELQAVLESNPMAVKRAGVVIQNSLIKVIASLLPQIMWVINAVAKMADAFANMNPAIQRVIMIFLLLLAALGPPLIILGSMAVAAGQLGKMFVALANTAKSPVAALRNLFGALGVGAKSTATATGQAAVATQSLEVNATRLTTTSAQVGAAMNAASTSTAGAATNLRGSAISMADSMRDTADSALLLQTTLSNVSGRISGSFAVMSTSISNSMTVAKTALDGLTTDMEIDLTRIATLSKTHTATIVADNKALVASYATRAAGVSTALGKEVSAIRTHATASTVAAGRIIKSNASLATSYQRLANAQSAANAARMGSENATAANAARAAGSGASSSASTARAARAAAGTQAAASATAARSAQTSAWAIATANGEIILSERAKAEAAAITGRELVVWNNTAVASLRATATNVRGASASIVADTVNVGRVYGTTAGQAVVAQRQIASSATGAAAVVRGASTSMIASNTAASASFVNVGRVYARVVPGIAASTGAVAASSTAAAAAGGGFFTRLLGRIRSFVSSIGAFLSRLGPMILRFLLGPWGLAITAVIVLISMFAGQIQQVFNNIVSTIQGSNSAVAQHFRSAWEGIVNIGNQAINAIVGGFNMLPQSVQNAFNAVIRVVSNAAMQVYEWMSYLNPFQRHSPSLVDNVKNGMSFVSGEFSKSGGKIGKTLRPASAAVKDLNKSSGKIGTTLRPAAAAAKNFSKSASSITQSVKPATTAIRNFGGSASAFIAYAKRMEQAAEFDLISKHAGAGVANAYMGMARNVQALTSRYNALGAQIKSQEATVARFEAAHDAANKRLERQREILEKLSDRVSTYRDKLSDARDVLNDFANAPIKGMQQMSDALFENEMAQKRLQLAMLDWEETNGSIEKVENNLASLQGSIEALRGEANDLRAAGAGSDVLGPINAQLAAMESAYDQMAKMPAPVGDTGTGEHPMTAELERLKKEAERLELQESLRFDPLTRQIDKLVNSTKELTFEQIIAGIKNQRGVIAGLEAQYDAATAAVSRQEIAVAQAQAGVDAAKTRYDAQNAALKALKDTYNELGSEIRDLESAMNDIVSAARQMQSALDAEEAEKARKGAKDAEKSWSPAAENFMNAAGGAYEDPGSAFTIGEGDLSIDDWLEQNARDAAGIFDSIDLFGGVRRAWDSLKSWWSTNVNPIFADFGRGIAGLFEGVSFDTSALSAAWDSVVGFWDSYVKPILGAIADTIGDALIEAWDSVSGAAGPALSEIMQPLDQLWQSLKNVWSVIKNDVWPVLQEVLTFVGVLIGGAILGAVSIVLGIITGIARALGPLISIISAVVAGIMKIISGIISVVTGIIQAIMGIITGDGEQLKQGFSKIWDGVKQIFDGAWQALWGIVYHGIQAVLQFIIGFFQGVWNFISNLIDRIFGEGTMQGIVDKVKTIFSGLGAFFQLLWEGIKMAFSAAWEFIQTYVFGPIQTGAQWVWNKFKDVGNGIVSAWDGMKSGLKAGWDWINNSVFSPVKNGAQWVWDKFKDVGNGVKNTWDNLGRALKTGWDWISTNVLNVARIALDGLKAFWETWKTGINNIWEGLKSLLRSGWVWIDNNVFAHIKTGVNLVKSGFDTAKNGINTAWEALKTLLRNGKNWIVDNAFDPLKTAANSIKTAFENVKDGISTAWNGLKRAAAVPINFVITDVYTNGIKAFWNRIKNAVGIEGMNLPNISRITGFARGTEDHRAQIARPGDMRLWAEPETGGEAYIPLASSKRHRSTQILSNVANRFGFNLHKYEDGGFWERAASAVSGAGRWVRDRALDIAEFATDPVGAMRDLMRRPVNAILENIGGGDFGRIVTKVPQKVVDGLTDKVRDFFTGDQLSRTLAGAGDWTRPANGPITSPFGAARRGGRHSGIDIGGTGPFFAARGGSVARAGWNILGGRSGIGVLLDHGGTLQTYYGHAAPGSLRVAAGDAVRAGQTMGQKGQTGVASGIHLHFEYLPHGPNNPVNPAVLSIFGGTQGGAGKSGGSLSAFPQAVSRWTGTASAALMRRHQYNTGNLNSLLRRMQQESGGNPYAINLWDSNARRGVPSQGLMQVIPPTFAHYRDRNLPNRIMDPMANIVASINYTLSRYGSLRRGWDRSGGYDQGGWVLPGKTLVNNQSGVPEAVLTGSQWGNVASMLTILNELLAERNTSSGPTEVNNTYNFYGDLSFPNIENGSDAEDFISNLTDLGGGR